MATLTLLHHDSFYLHSATSTSRSTMNLFKRKFSSSKKSSPTVDSIPAREAKSNGKSPRVLPSVNPRVFSSVNPFQAPPGAAMPTRRPKTTNNAPPPPYTPTECQITAPGQIQATDDSPYAFLTQFDTVFLIDDSGSMAGRSWRETSAAISAIAPICTTYDKDGLDIYFLNHRNLRASTNLGGFTNVTTTAGVEAIFNSVRPLGGTPTGTRLHNILKPYLAELEDSIEREAHGHAPSVKPLNVIVITDGVPSDDVETVIVNAAKRLDACNAEPWQVGIQFFQVGREPSAAEDLQDLDDALSSTHHIRDMVDTVPWGGDDGQVLTAEKLLKICLGSVNRRLDRRTVG